MAVTPIALDRRLVRVSGQFASDMGGEKVLMSVASGKYYNLGAVGGRIWELLEEPRSVRELTEALTAEYDVDAGTCAAQIEPFLQLLLKESLIRHEDGAAG